ncbi:MAG: flagellar export protein FliJ [Spongiibacteraceae bacterium]
MKKTASQRLQTVLKIAQLRERAAAEKLAVSIRNVDAVSQQQQQLEQYKNEYNDHFQALGAQGQSVGQLSNFIRFYSSLDGAAVAQGQRLALAQDQRDAASKLWRQQYSRQKNMQKLVEKKQQQEQCEQDNKAQREQDDRKYTPLLI